MRFLTVLALALCAPAAFAQPAVVPYGEIAVEFGGDEVVELLFTNGNSQTLRAGQGLTAAAGLRVQPVPTVPVSGFAQVGYKFLLNASDNADIRLTRFPIEVGVHGHITPDVWAEAAYTRHLSVSLNGDGFFPDEEFDSSNGVTLGAGWRWIGASYTIINYTAQNGTEIDASNVGITLRISSNDF